jgi:hypothetical protein
MAVKVYLGSSSAAHSEMTYEEADAFNVTSGGFLLIQRQHAGEQRDLAVFAPNGFQNLVERWFAELTNRKLRRSAHRSVTELETDIRKWITEWNKDPKPFVWTKTADEILETLAAYCGLITGSGH